MVSNLGKTIDNIIKEGKMKGLEEDRKEGRKEGKSELIIKMLSKKFNKLPENYVHKIDDLSDETLDKIAVDIFDMKRAEELERYFKN